MAALFLIPVAGTSYAGPQGMTVVSGSAHATQKGNTLQITTSQNASLQWKTFNIAAGETTVFHQPSASSIVLNYINSGNPSAIYGSLRANGIVVLENQSGFYFGPNAFVHVGGLVVTTAAVNPWSAGGGAGWVFDGLPAVTPIVNYGHLETGAGGSLYLISKDIENHGTIEAPGGIAALLGGEQVLLSLRPDGLSLSMPVKLPAGSVDNQGRIVADAGQVLLQAQTVNNSGVIQANSVRVKNGAIELYASDDVQLQATSVIEASGGAEGVSPGGNITIKSGGAFSDSAGSQITAAGGANGGNGGNIEVSAASVLSLNSKVDAGAHAGWSGGLFSLDPENIVLGTTGTTGPDSSGTINGTGNSGALNVNVNTAFQNITAGQILLEASGNISLNSGTIWDLSASTGSTSGQLTLEAGGSILLNNRSGIQDENNWSVALEAGYNFAAGRGVLPGVGSAANNVNLLGNAFIETALGNINVLAGNNVTVGSGGIVTGIANGDVISGTGGNVNVQAVAGNVSSTSTAGGYSFTTTSPGYAVNPNLGGISTASGGDVTIQAGGNISSTLPAGRQNVTSSDFGCGAFGAAPGNVTLTAGGNVTGHYVVANGTGTIQAGGNAGTPNANLALSLINGGWSVNAGNNIYLQEVRNPNGVFNFSPYSYPVSYLFNYSPNDWVSLAANGVTITGGSTTSLPRFNPNEGLIFPPVLTINAGAGGITFDTTVNLFPSPQGTLDITTTGGGNVQGLAGAGAIINISDSSRSAYLSSQAFLYNDPDQYVLLHLNDPYPVMINVSGSLENLALDSPKAAQISVAGNIVDCSANIQNLHSIDITSITAGGQIIDQNNFVAAQLQPGQKPNFSALNTVSQQTILGPDGLTLIPNPNYNGLLNDLQNYITYNARTGTLLYLGAMTVVQENALLGIHFLDKTDLDYIQQQSQNEGPSGLDYTVSGPGTFRIKAASLSLGNEGGIISEGFGASSQLASVTPKGADIDITVAGDLNMVASSIESEYGGAINIMSGGSVDVGSPVLGQLVNQEENGGVVFGIVSVWGGNINVTATGNIDVDSSRIASYDGGNIFVESLKGDVNAGTGGFGQVSVTKPFLSKNGSVGALDDFIPGSGIMTTTYPQLAPGQGPSEIGNITVQTPQGNIQASSGGISQLPLGPVANNGGTINLTAGSKNSDGTVAYVGNVVANGSGVIGGHVNITATGNINGLILASQGANVSALQNVNATVLSQGSATVTAGDTVSGSVVGGLSVTVSGGKGDTASALSSIGNVNASGPQSGQAVAAAPTGSSSNAGTSATTQVNSTIESTAQSNPDLASNGTGDENDPNKKRTLLQTKEYVGRVKVLLPE